MTGRSLIIPAAGIGSRLGSHLPKPLASVCGTPMVSRVLSLYATYVDSVVVVASPSTREALASAVGALARIAVQAAPTGMLDAILAAAPHVPSDARWIWITWCDQVGVEPATIAALAATIDAHPDAAVVMPTVRTRAPYIHLQRDPSGRIARVLHRREGDEMPDEGESDMGLFALSAAAFRDLLPAFSDAASQSAHTRERNFLPFLPWVAARAAVVTFAATDPAEARGINTPDDLAAVERRLRERGRA